MKIISLEINCTRGIKNLKLDFNGNNAVIYGDNGTGKSGVIDAIDFLIKGDITRLAGTGTKGLTLNKHGKYVTEDISESWVKAVVKLPQYEELITIQRYLNNPTSLICDPKYSEDFALIGNLANIQAHYLSRREILQFINATEQDRAKSIEKLLNLQLLEKNRNALQKTKKNFEESLKSKQQQVKSYHKSICDKLGVREDDWLDAVNEIRFSLGANELEKLDESLILSNISLTKTDAQKAEINSLVQRFQDIFKGLNSESDGLSFHLTSLKEVEEKLLLLKNFNDEINSLLLFEQGVVLIKDNACPLCGQTISQPTELISCLQEKISNLKTTKHYHDELKKCYANVIQASNTIKRLLTGINQDMLAKYADCVLFTDFLCALNSLAEKAQDSNLSIEIIDSFLNEKYDVVLHDFYYTQLFSKLTSLSLDQKEQKYKALVDINSDYCLYIKSLREFDLAHKQANRSVVFFEKYVESQTYILNQMYDTIKDRFSMLYRLIHESDETAFDSAFIRKPASLELQVKFKDGNLYPPNAVHSEGHQDSMGICLFFALSEKISNNHLDLILLDDVVMSIDIDHRKNFCKILREQFPDKQFIITTHDYIWRKELESHSVVKNSNVVYFKAWDIEHGPYVEVDNNIWTTIDNLLSKGQKNEAIGLLRYYMEEFFSNICATYKLKVPYSQTGRWTLEDVITPSHTFYNKSFKKALDSVQSYKKDTTQISNICEKFAKAYNDLQVERWAINPSTHFTAWAQNFSIDELKSVTMCVKSYCNLYECNTCGSLIAINADMNGNPENICCNCGDHAFSCIKNKQN